MKKFKFEAAPGQDDAILEELGGLEDSEEEEKPVSTAEVKENSSPKYYNAQIKKELEAYRQVKLENKFAKPTVESNLNQIFCNFQVFTQQRHKVSLQEVDDFVPEYSNDEIEMVKHGLVSQLFSQLNPFSQFVIEEIVSSQVHKDEDKDDEETRMWHLHEDLFKNNS